MTDKIKCPLCGNEVIASCPGGTCYKPNKWAMQNIKYLCTNGDCLNEFGDNNITEIVISVDDWNKLLSQMEEKK